MKKGTLIIVLALLIPFSASNAMEVQLGIGFARVEVEEKDPIKNEEEDTDILSLAVGGEFEDGIYFFFEYARFDVSYDESFIGFNLNKVEASLTTLSGILVARFEKVDFRLGLGTVRGEIENTLTSDGVFVLNVGFGTTNPTIEDEIDSGSQVILGLDIHAGKNLLIGLESRQIKLKVTSKLLDSGTVIDVAKREDKATLTSLRVTFRF